MRLAILLSIFLMLFGATFLSDFFLSFASAGRIALSATFLLSGIFHLKFHEGVALTYPDFIPVDLRVRLPLAISDLLFGFAAGLLYADIAAIIIPFVLIYLLIGLITQIKAAKNKVSIKRGNFTGYGLAYLWFTIPQQLVLITWAYYFVLICSF